jgi:hypothetical protein
MARLYVLDYPFAMKYVWIIVVVVVMVRIDFFISLIESTTSKISNSRAPEMKVNDVGSNTEIISIKNDQSLKVSPRTKFLSMLEDFRIDSSALLRMQAIEHLKSHPQLFNDNLDKDLESRIYQWRDLLSQRNPETHYFLLDLLQYLKGENQNMVRRFYSLAMDIDLADFLTAYSKSKDTTCQIGVLVADSLPEDERFNELAARLTALESVLKKEKLDIGVKVMALRCEASIKLALDTMQLAAQTPAEAVPPAPLPEPSPNPSPEPVPLPSPDPSSGSIP